MTVKNTSIAYNLEDNQNYIANIFRNSPDLCFREVSIGLSKVLIVYLNGLVDIQSISSFIIKPLMDFSYNRDGEHNQLIINPDLLGNKILNNSYLQSVNTYDEIIQGLLAGQTVLFLAQFQEALLLETFGAESRKIQPPETESIVRGPREGFVEKISVNASLLRRRIKDKDLRLEAMNLGQRTRTTIYITYIEGIANPKLVRELKKRLVNVDIDAILESGYVEQLIEDEPQSIFPTVGNTERPDILAGKLLEGRVGIMVDGTPFVLTVPYLFVEAFQNAEDYYARPYYASAVRLIRYMAFYFTTMLPAFYVAVQTYHQEMIPTSLIVKMSVGREGIPFPVIVEALAMGIMYEILREAGIRMPGIVGQAVSIVGALVIGEASVQAGLVSPSMVIVVALTAISGFLIPPLAGPFSLLRLYFLIATAFMGMFGWLVALIALLIHMMSMRSFGVPYMSPIVPTNIGDLKDGFIRVPLWAMISRPSLLSSHRRQGKKNWRNMLKRIKQK